MSRDRDDRPEATPYDAEPAERDMSGAPEGESNTLHSVAQREAPEADATGAGATGAGATRATSGGTGRSATGDIPGEASMDPAGNVSSEAPAHSRGGARPRTRWAAIIWGCVFLALAGVGFAWSVDANRFDLLRSAIRDWYLDLDALSGTVSVVIVIGALLVVAGLTGLARRLQRRADPAGDVGGGG